MQSLIIFYDENCGLCRSFRKWLMQQPVRVRVQFMAYNSAEALRLFPRMLEVHADQDIVVLADDGRWWQGAAAWLTCLWATHEYHPWSYRMAEPSLLPLVSKMVKLISTNRLRISTLLRLRCDRSLVDTLSAAPAPVCVDGSCRLPGLQTAKAMQSSSLQEVES